MIQVTLPAMLRRPGQAATFELPGTLATVADLMAALEPLVPGLAASSVDAIFNIAVNDELLLHGVDAHPLRDGDRVEIVPTISGG